MSTVASKPLYESLKDDACVPAVIGTDIIQIGTCDSFFSRKMSGFVVISDGYELL